MIFEIQASDAAKMTNLLWSNVSASSPRRAVTHVMMHGTDRDGRKIFDDVKLEIGKARKWTFTVLRIE